MFLMQKKNKLIQTTWENFRNRLSAVFAPSVYTQEIGVIPMFSSIFPGIYFVLGLITKIMTGAWLHIKMSFKTNEKKY